MLRTKISASQSLAFDRHESVINEVKGDPRELSLWINVTEFLDKNDSHALPHGILRIRSLQGIRCVQNSFGWQFCGWIYWAILKCKSQLIWLSLELTMRSNERNRKKPSYRRFSWEPEIEREKMWQKCMIVIISVSMFVCLLSSSFVNSCPFFCRLAARMVLTTGLSMCACAPRTCRAHTRRFIHIVTSVCSAR